MVKKILGFVAKHSGTILTVAAGAGVVATGVTAHKNTLKAATNDKGIKNYIPSIAVGAATIGTIVGMDILHVRKEKALIAMAGMSEIVLRRMTADKELKDTEGTDDYSKKGMNKDFMAGEVVNCLCEDIHESYSDSSAKMLCYEPYTKTFFKASQTDLLLAEREINSTLMNGGGTRVIDFVSRFNPHARKWVDPTNTGWWMDDDYAWNSSFFGYYLTMMPKIEEVEGQLCLVMYWSHEPAEMEEGFLPIS